MNESHSIRKHSKFSASGATRWFNCPGSVSLSEGIPDKDTSWSVEGTKAHEVLEDVLRLAIKLNTRVTVIPLKRELTKLEAMCYHGGCTTNFIFKLWRENKKSDILVETRVKLDFIHPEMFGTLDAAVLDHFGTLHVFDYKYGAGHPVSPIENLQMIFYGLGLAHKYDWNFKDVKLWIIQPRIKSFDGPLFWALTIPELKAYISRFKKATQMVIQNPTKYHEGPWCHFCKAKIKCPLKLQARTEKAQLAFLNTPISQGVKNV